MPRKYRTLDPSPLFEVLTKANDVQLAKRLGVSRSAINRWRNGSRRIRIRTADEIATKLNLHPINIWGDDFLDLDND